jgi:TPR repeat protein
MQFTNAVLVLMVCFARVMWLRQMIIILLLLIVATPSGAQNFYKGMEAYRQADYGTARREWEPLAVRGDDLAQYNMGVLYDSGLGVPVDKARALLWYRKSAEQGFALAQNNLGRMFYAGDSVPPNYARAVVYFRKAADQGVAFSHFFLGMIYAGGGPGVRADPIQAYQWLTTASDLHKSPRYRNDALASRALIGQGMAPNHISVAERLAFDWMDKFKRTRAPEQ